MISKNDGKSTEELFDDLYKNDSTIVWYKFVDTFRARNFVPDQPADRLLIYKSQTWLVEIKSSMDLVRFPLKNISKKQIGHGRKWQKAGAKEIFIIHNIPNNEFYFVPFKYIDELFKANQSSIKWDELLVFNEVKDYKFFKT